MHLTPKQLASFSLSGFVLSLLVHALTLSGIYYVSGVTIGALTVGMLAIWLLSSKMVRQLSDQDKHPWKTVFASVPDWLRYLFFFIVVYALINALLSIQTNTGIGYFESQVSPQKIRLISGFWMIIYMLGFMVGIHNREIGSEE